MGTALPIAMVLFTVVGVVAAIVTFAVLTKK